MALGAFVTGLLLAETEFRRAIETAIDPFKGLLLGLFFFTVGMSIEIREIVSHPLALIGAVIALVAVKGLIVAGLMRLFDFRWPAAIESAFLLGPAGEFAFIVLGMAAVSGLMPSDQSHFLIAVVSISMALIPVFDIAAKKIARRFNNKIVETDPALIALPSEDQARPRHHRGRWPRRSARRPTCSIGTPSRMWSPSASRSSSAKRARQGGRCSSATAATPSS